MANRFDWNIAVQACVEAPIWALRQTPLSHQGNETTFAYSNPSQSEDNMMIKSFSTFLVPLVLFLPLPPSFGATIEVFSHDEQGDLQVNASQLTMLSHSQVHPSPDLFTDGQIHVALGAPEISISFDGSSFGPLLASLTRVDGETPFSLLNQSPISSPVSKDRPAVVPVEQLPFAPLDIPNNAPGGVGGSISPSLQFLTPNNSLDSLGLTTITIEGTIDIPSPQNTPPIPLPGAFWFYLTGITAFGLLQRAFNRKAMVPSPTRNIELT